MSRRFQLVALLTVVALASGTGAVLAGARNYAPLVIYDAGHSADGGLADTHNTADTTQYAECGSNPWAGYCTLVDSAGTYYGCYTVDPAFMAVIRSMSPDSLFNVVWDDSSVCTYVLSYASSRTPPRAP